MANKQMPDMLGSHKRATKIPLPVHARNNLSRRRRCGCRSSKCSSD